MKKLFVSIATILLAVWVLNAQTVPVKIKSFLDEYYTTASGAWQQAPGFCDAKKWALIGDFNGDGRLDYVVRIKTRAEAGIVNLNLIAFLKEGTEYDAVPFMIVQNKEDFLQSSFSVIKKGTTVDQGLGAEGEGPMVKLKADAITSYICETDASRTYIYSDGKFENIQDVDFGGGTAPKPQVIAAGTPNPRPTPFVPSPTPVPVPTSIPIGGNPGGNSPSNPPDLTGIWQTYEKNGSLTKDPPVQILHLGSQFTMLTGNGTKLRGLVKGDAFIISIELTAAIEQHGNIIRFRSGTYMMRNGYTGPVGTGTGIPKLEQKCLDMITLNNITWGSSGDPESDKYVPTLLCMATDDPAATIACFKKETATKNGVEAMKVCSAMWPLMAQAGKDFKQDNPTPGDPSVPVVTPPIGNLPNLAGDWTMYAANGTALPGVGKVSYMGDVITFEIKTVNSMKRATAYVKDGVINTGWNTTCTVSADGKILRWSDGTRWVRQ